MLRNWDENIHTGSSAITGFMNPPECFIIYIMNLTAENIKPNNSF